MKTPLEGIKILDYSWVGSGPASARYLGDHGAVVVRVESITRPDPLRLSPPFRDGIVHPDRSAYYANYNAGKLGVTLNLSTPGGRDTATRLVRWCDVLLESFTPGTMKNWGLDYESLRELNPSLIMASTTQLGQTGPRAHFHGFGVQGAALAGFCEVSGRPDDEPIGPWAAYTDFIAHRYLIIAILAALRHRRHTGKGQYIDLSQVECALHFLGPSILDYAVNGRVVSRAGNAEAQAAPHGAYPCRGHDRWCVIAVYTDLEWDSFCRAIGDPAWARGRRFGTLLGRKEHEAELDRLVGQWTAGRPPDQVMTVLQQAGVAAGIVETAEDLHNDPQLKHRDHFWRLKHPIIGEHTYDAPACRLSKTPARASAPAPCLGEHTYLVCTELLGMTDEEFASLEEAGTFA